MIKTTHIACCWLLGTVVLAAPAWAQLDAEPAIKTETQTAGTTIVGDRESPIGLYITPWRNAAPESELDRPARFLEEQMLPLDPDVFRRQIEYYNTISDHLRVRGNRAPASR